MEQATGCVFQGWLEGSIKFAPTYKYAMNSDQYSTFIEKQSWTQTPYSFLVYKSNLSCL